ncbi:hypothetical protein RQP46_001635 [Phenoliferia psychrophenolica]
MATLARSSRLPSLSAPLRSLVWHNDATKFLGIAEYSLSVWTKDGSLLRELERSDSDAHLPITSALFLGRDSLVFASGDRVYSYGPDEDAPATTLGSPSSTGPITALALNADESLLATTSGSLLIVHNLQSSSNSTLTARPKAPFTTLKFHPSRRTFLAAGTTSGVVHLFDTTKPSAPLKSISLSSGAPSPAPISNLAFQLGAGLLLVAADENGRLAIIDSKQLKSVAEKDTGIEMERGGMTLSGDARTVVVGGRGVVHLIDLRTRSKPVEVRIGNGKDKILGIALEPVRPRSDRPPSPTKTAVASPHLVDSLNHLRQTKLASDLLARKAFPSSATSTIASTSSFLPSKPTALIADDLPLSKLAFADPRPSRSFPTPLPLPFLQHNPQLSPPPRPSPHH